MVSMLDEMMEPCISLVCGVFESNDGSILWLALEIVGIEFPFVVKNYGLTFRSKLSAFFSEDG